MRRAARVDQYQGNLFDGTGTANWRTLKRSTNQNILDICFSAGVLRKCIFPILREIVEQSKKQGCREGGIVIGPQGPTPARYLAGKGWSAAPHRARATWLPLARTNVRLKANNFLERVQYWQSQTVQGARHRQYSAVFLSLDFGNVRSRQPPVADPSLCDSHHI
jgi:hypothetical protein